MGIGDRRVVLTAELFPIGGAATCIDDGLESGASVAGESESLEAMVGIYFSCSHPPNTVRDNNSFLTASVLPQLI